MGGQATGCVRNRRCDLPKADLHRWSTRCCCGRCRSRIPSGSRLLGTRPRSSDRSMTFRCRMRSISSTPSRAAPPTARRGSATWRSASPIRTTRSASRRPAVTASFFDVLRTPPRLGRPFTAEEDRPGAAPVVVLGDGLWRSRFGAAPRVVGRLHRLPRLVPHLIPRDSRDHRPESSRGALVRLPNSVYWNALTRWGIEGRASVGASHAPVGLLERAHAVGYRGGSSFFRPAFGSRRSSVFMQ